MEYVLETKALCKTYKHYKALDNLTMHVPKGAIYGFVGKNGAGKTTLIRLITGLQFPTAGSYQIYGVDNTSPQIRKSRRRMGAVVETPSIYLDMTARDNMQQQYRILGQPGYDGIPELLELVGLGDTGKKKVKDFPWVCGRDWASPSPLRETRIFLCWMSRSTARTPRASLRSGS